MAGSVIAMAAAIGRAILLSDPLLEIHRMAVIQNAA